MASFRGRSVSRHTPPDRHAQHEKLNALKTAVHPDRRQLHAFLEAADSAELSELGEALSSKTASYRSRLLGLLAEFAKDADWNVRDSVARLSGPLGDPGATTTLEELLAEPNAPLVRHAALQSLWTLHAIEPDQVEALLGDPTPLIRGGAARILATTSRRNAIIRLLADPDEAVRSDVAETLGTDEGSPAHHTQWGRAIPLSLSSSQQEAALAAIETLERSHEIARSIARRLRTAVLNRRIHESTLAQHSRWCHSDSSYRDSVQPACDAALAMYGFIPERLVDPSGKRVDAYDRLMSRQKTRVASRNGARTS
jgi:HEAT repeats